MSEDAKFLEEFCQEFSKTLGANPTVGEELE